MYRSTLPALQNNLQLQYLVEFVITSIIWNISNGWEPDFALRIPVVRKKIHRFFVCFGLWASYGPRNYFTLTTVSVIPLLQENGVQVFAWKFETILNF